MVTPGRPTTFRASAERQERFLVRDSVHVRQRHLVFGSTGAPPVHPL